jgi:hypothetical protein
VDYEAPIDAWYVWIALTIASVAIAGIALSLPAKAPPDADKAANTIDEVSKSTGNASAAYEHGATAVRLDRTRIAMRNDAGTDRARIAFGRLTPVRAHPTNAAPGEKLLSGARVGEIFASPADLATWAKQSRKAVTTAGGEWRPATGRLRLRRISWANVTVLLIDA